MAVSLLLRQETETQRSEVVLGSSVSQQGTVAEEEVREETWEKPRPAWVLGGGQAGVHFPSLGFPTSVVCSLL